MQPDLILVPFAQDAPAANVDAIPVSLSPSDPPQAASWSQGFPAVTMTPLAAGGIPPRGQSFNGVLQDITQHLVYIGGGGQYRWSSEYVAAKGGYSIGDVIQADSGMLSYVSLADNNTDNFNTDPSSIGPKWRAWAGGQAPNATTDQRGAVLLATQTQVNAGSGDAVVTPEGRALAAQIQASVAFATSGTATEQVLTPSPAIPAYAPKQRFNVTFGVASGANPTINISGRGAKNLKQYDSTGAKVAAVFAAGQISDIVYDGADFVILDPLPKNSLVDPWASQPLGVPIGMFFDTAEAIPPTNNSAYRYIKLTSGDTYNDGVLTSESVSGAAPLILASAVISLAGSPFNGLTVQLINTERRALRAGAARTIEQDQIQNITGSMIDSSTALSSASFATGAFKSLQNISSRPSPQAITGLTWDFDASRVVRAGTETRSKNVGVTYFMRIK